MIVQVPERIIYKGELLNLHTEPLAGYLAQIIKCPDFCKDNKKLGRGYVGTWEIKEESLYLIEINGVLKNGEKLALNKFFPESAYGVFASWFSGNLKICEGEFLPLS